MDFEYMLTTKLNEIEKHIIFKHSNAYMYTKFTLKGNEIYMQSKYNMQCKYNAIFIYKTV